MNVFCSHSDPVISAKVLADKHVVKMCTETAQILSTALHARGLSYDDLYRPAYVKHPCCLVAAENESYFAYSLRHGLALCAEYTHRYGRTHAAETVLARIKGLTDPHTDFSTVLWDPNAHADLKIPLAMPDIYKQNDPYESYRTYLRAKYQNWRDLSRPPKWKIPLEGNYLEN